MAIANVKDLLGVKLLSVTKSDDDGEIIFVAEDGRRWKMFHEDDWCESVTVEDVIGDLNDLIGSEILMAEEVVSGENPEDVKKDFQDSFTWTFYKFATAKGYVTIRWYGESDGYYSESVDFELL